MRKQVRVVTGLCFVAPFTCCVSRLRLRMLSAALSSPGSAEPLKHLFKIIRRILLAAVFLYPSAKPCAAWLAGSTLLGVVTASSAALQAAKDWASKAKSNKLEYSDCFALADKVCSLRALCCGVVSWQPCAAGKRGLLACRSNLV
jgi:hypothetical protein